MYTDQTRYRTYLLVRDAIEAGINQLRDDLSQRYYGEPYSRDMPFVQRRRIDQELDFTYAEQEYYRLANGDQSTEPKIWLQRLDW